MVVSRDVCLIGRDRSLSDSFHLVRMMERMETSGMVTVSERKRINFQDFANGTQPFAQIHMFFFYCKVYQWWPFTHTLPESDEDRTREKECKRLK